MSILLRSPTIILVTLCIVFPKLLSAGAFHCPLGDPVSASLGDGVIMYTCMWEKAPSVIIRTGPLELVKNGILILKSQTDNNGKLHGKFTSWNDQGIIIENGNYVMGLKDGEWLVTDKHGVSETLFYRKGNLVKP